MKLLLTILLSAGFMFSFMLIYERNAAIERAYDAYHNKNYGETIAELELLSDSLDYDLAGIQLNKAHAVYQKNGFSGLNGINNSRMDDSTYLQIVESTFYEYTRLWEAEETLASRAYHQAGMTTFKSRIVNNELAEEEKLIDASMNYFRSALRKDPYNEKARYNYEILKKYREFPEKVMERVKNLVKQRRYREAYTYLAPYAQNDSRFSQYAEFAKRLGDIVKIEEQYGGS